MYISSELASLAMRHSSLLREIEALGIDRVQAQLELLAWLSTVVCRTLTPPLDALSAAFPTAAFCDLRRLVSDCLGEFSL